MQEKKIPPKNDKKWERERTFLCVKAIHKMRENCKL